MLSIFPLHFNYFALFIGGQWTASPISIAGRGCEEQRWYSGLLQCPRDSSLEFSYLRLGSPGCGSSPRQRTDEDPSGFPARPRRHFEPPAAPSHKHALQPLRPPSGGKINIFMFSVPFADKTRLDAYQQHTPCWKLSARRVFIRCTGYGFFFPPSFFYLFIFFPKPRPQEALVSNYWCVLIISRNWLWKRKGTEVGLQCYARPYERPARIDPPTAWSLVNHANKVEQRVGGCDGWKPSFPRAPLWPGRPAVWSATQTPHWFCHGVWFLVLQSCLICPFCFFKHFRFSIESSLCLWWLNYNYN